jgi:hypothetical protein
VNKKEVNVKNVMMDIIEALIQNPLVKNVLIVKKMERFCDKTNGECFECIDDSYFGPKCEKQCSITCNDRKCFQNGTCFSCINNYYGNTCEKKM